MGPLGRRSSAVRDNSPPTRRSKRILTPDAGPAANGPVCAAELSHIRRKGIFRMPCASMGVRVATRAGETSSCSNAPSGHFTCEPSISGGRSPQVFLATPRAGVWRSEGRWNRREQREQRSGEECSGVEGPTIKSVVLGAYGGSEPAAPAREVAAPIGLACAAGCEPYSLSRIRLPDK